MITNKEKIISALDDIDRYVKNILTDAGLFIDNSPYKDADKF